jgi:hypothetical protein
MVPATWGYPAWHEGMAPAGRRCLHVQNFAEYSVVLNVQQCFDGIVGAPRNRDYGAGNDTFRVRLGAGTQVRGVSLWTWTYAQ